MIKIKKIILSIILLFLFSKNVNAISASSVVAMDLTTNRVLYEQNMNNKRLIASISKIMSCIIAIENADLESTVTVKEEVLKSFGSGIYIEVGEKIKFKDLLYGLMLRSGNDAAIEIAYNTANDMESFVKLMNDKAKEIGMTNTTFINSHGLEDEKGNGNVSTAYDMALLTSYAYQNETFKQIFGTKKYTAKSDRKTYSWTNKNKILHSYDFITGGKTGYTKKAKRTLVTTAEKDNKKIVIVTLNDGNDFNDHIDLYQKIFKEYEAVEMLNKDSFYLEDCKDCYIKNNFYALVNKKEKENLTYEYILEKNSTSEYAGLSKVYLNNKLLYEQNIYKKVNIQEKKSIFQKLKEWLLSW